MSTDSVTHGIAWILGIILLFYTVKMLWIDIKSKK